MCCAVNAEIASIAWYSMSHFLQFFLERVALD